MKLIDEWKNAWKFLSVQIPALGATLTLAWASMPDDWKSATPKWAIMACVFLFFIAAIAGRFVKQGKGGS
jgi:hypothetical protein